MATRITAEALETLASGSPAVRVTAVALETVSNPGNPAVRETQIALEVFARGIQVFCNNPPNGTVGTAYAAGAFHFTTQGGVAPLLFAVTSGQIPPGLTLNPTTGALTGTPTKAGTYTFTLTVTDSGTTTNVLAGGSPAAPPTVRPGQAAAGTAAYMGLNSAGTPYWAIACSFETPASIPVGVAGYVIAVRDTDVSGNASPDPWGAPRDFFTTGITTSTLTTQILLGGYQSSPTSPYTYIEFQAYQFDGSGNRTMLGIWPPGFNSGVQRVNYGTVPSMPASIVQPLGAGSTTCTITIGLGTLAGTCGTPPTATVGSTFSFRPPVTIGGVTTTAADDAAGTITWSVTGLPPGLSWNVGAGAIQGTPTAAGTFIYTATVNAVDGQHVTFSCNLTVVLPGGGGGGGGGSGPGICGATPLAIVGSYWFYQPPFTTGVGVPTPPNWTFSGLPAGIGWDINPASSTYGFLVGTPSPPASVYNYTAQYTVAGVTTTFACSINVQLPGGIGQPPPAGPCLYLELNLWQPLFAFGNPNEQIEMPPAYERALRYALARELAAFYPGRDPAEVTALAVQAEIDVDQLNISNQLAVEDAPQPMPPPAATTGD